MIVYPFCTGSWPETIYRLVTPLQWQQFVSAIWKFWRHLQREKARYLFIYKYTILLKIVEARKTAVASAVAKVEQGRAPTVVSEEIVDYMCHGESEMLRAKLVTAETCVFPYDGLPSPEHREIIKW